MAPTWTTGRVDRRRFLGGLGGLAALSALAVLPGCTEEDIKKILDTCPTNSAESGGVNWIPDIGHPVFWGFQDLTTAANGTPRDLRIYYPTVEGVTDAPPILKLCLVQWPVVLFLHGQPPNGVSLTGYHRRWWQIPAVLARCGYVVVVPNHPALLPKDDFEPMVAAAMADVDWVRNQWSDAKWVHKSLIAVAGHSYGALLASRVALTRPEIDAFVSLSGPYSEFNTIVGALSPITAPSFFMWANGDSLGLVFEDLDGTGRPWDQLTQSKYAAVFQGEHFDYLAASDTGTAPRGPCPVVGAVTADLAALFIASNVQVPLGRTNVAVDLKPPQEQQTLQQEFYLGGHLNGLGSFQRHAGCRLDLRWSVNGATGSRRLGP